MSKFRPDIEGLRAFAVIPVIFFHLSLMPNGYLGVDVFFVISGFLITGLIYSDLGRGSFSLLDFYIRRARRILPLCLFVVTITLIFGSLTMLPDDLENLGQSVIATNFFANNILQAITTQNYWDVVNEFKPLMHTWSLGVEEQFYIILPILLILIARTSKTIKLTVLYSFTIISLILFFTNAPEFKKFYFIWFRFWELAMGGLVAIHLKGRLITYENSFIPIVVLLFMLVIPHDLGNQFSLIAVVLLTSMVLATNNNSQRVSKFFLENRIVRFIGLISFSLYMWHQVVFAFSRYFWKQQFLLLDYFVLISLVLLLSIFSYRYIERPFRKRVPIKYFISIVFLVFSLTSLYSWYLYINAGVLKNIPELDIDSSNISRGMHSKYNHAIFDLDKSFSNNHKIKVLIVGDSFARDWANVLKESKYSTNIDISYIFDFKFHQSLKERINDADVVFFSTPKRSELNKIEIDFDKVWAIGFKNFGVSNGIFYNYSGPGFYDQRTKMMTMALTFNNDLKAQWGDRFIDLIKPVIDNNGMVPIFTPEGKFISQDTRHFTKAGAEFYSQLLEKDLDFIFLPLIK